MSSWSSLVSPRSPKIIELVAHAARADQAKHVRVFLGWEPFDTGRVVFGSPAEYFTADVRRYWTEERGVSLRLSGKIVVLQALTSGWFEVRFVPGQRHLHAKMYVGDTAATMGSSNFTEAGPGAQFEANTRFEQGSERARFHGLKLIAENYWGSR